MNAIIPPPDDNRLGELEDITSAPRKIPSISSLLHILWLRKWIALGAWLIISIPVGILLSIYNLPKSYSVATVMRFPQVVGAQTNVMRDIAITEGQSIISIFNSHQVLDATIRLRGLRLRITTPHIFQRDVFKEIHYGDNLGLGKYSLRLKKNGSLATLSYKPSGSENEFKIFDGPLRTEGRLIVADLEMQFTPEFISEKDEKVITLEYSPFEGTIRELKKNVSARPLGGGNFEIRMKDRDPYFVADILNTLRDQFLDVYYGTSEVQDVGILVQMEKDLELAKARLEKSQDEVSQYYAMHPELNQQEIPSQNESMAYLESRQLIGNLQARKTRVQQVYAAKEPGGSSEKTYFWAMELLSAMTEAGEAKANILRSSLLDLNSEQLAQKRTLSPEHPKIKETEAQMEEVFQQIEVAEAELIRRMDRDLASAQQKMVVNTPRSNSRPAVKIQLELERLNNTNTNNQNIYDRLLESYNRAKLVTGSEFFKVTVVDPARAAQYTPPSSKTRLLIAAVAILFLLLIVPGLVLAWGLVFIKIWTKDDVRRLLNLKTLGVIGLSTKKKKGKSKHRKIKDGAPATVKDYGVDPLLLIYGENFRTEDLESFRNVREEIENAFKNKNAPGKYCVMITSSRPHEGKSTCAANLAVTFARKGKRTILIDADFRLGRTAKIFNQKVDTGIDTLLDQPDMSAEQFLESSSLAFQPTVQRNLVIAPCKSAKPNASELVSSDRFKAFIRMVKEQFDVVIIDTPPVLITPEPLSLGALADGIIFVCRSGMTVASEAREALTFLRERNLRVGAILNGVDISPFEENRYSKYSYYYQVQPKMDPQAE